MRRLATIVILVGLVAIGFLARDKIADLFRKDTQDYYKTACLIWNPGGVTYFPSAEEAAQHDVISVDASRVFDHELPESYLDSLSMHNPDIIVLLYVTVNSVYKWQLDNQDELTLWNRAWVTALGDYLAPAVTCGPCEYFPGAYLLDVTKPAARTRMVELIGTFMFMHSRPNLGLFLDYFSSAIYSSNQPDIDLDGVPMNQDPGEIREWTLAERELARMLRERLPNTILIGNGNMSRGDDELQAYLDGCMIEGAGLYGYGDEPIITFFTGGEFLSIEATKARFSSRIIDPLILMDYKYAEPWAVLIAQMGGVCGVVSPPGPGRGWAPPDPYFDLGKPLGGYQWLNRELNSNIGTILLNNTGLTRKFEKGELVLTLNRGGWDNPDGPFTWAIEGRKE